MSSTLTGITTNNYLHIYDYLYAGTNVKHTDWYGVMYEFILGLGSGLPLTNDSRVKEGGCAGRTLNHKP